MTILLYVKPSLLMQLLQELLLFSIPNYINWEEIRMVEQDYRNTV